MLKRAVNSLIVTVIVAAACFAQQNADTVMILPFENTSDKPEFDIPMDVQVGFINKLDVATFRSRLIDAETGLGNHVPLLVSPWAYSTYRGS